MADPVPVTSKDAALPEQTETSSGFEVTIGFVFTVSVAAFEVETPHWPVTIQRYL